MLKELSIQNANSQNKKYHKTSDLINKFNIMSDKKSNLAQEAKRSYE